jgi:hypothetical protein
VLACIESCLKRPASLPKNFVVGIVGVRRSGGAPLSCGCKGRRLTYWGPDVATWLWTDYVPKTTYLIPTRPGPGASKTPHTQNVACKSQEHEVVHGFALGGR